MRALAAVLTLAAAALIAAAPASAATKSSSKCSTAGTTLVQNQDARVYSLAKSDDDPVYACYFKAGKKVRLGTFNNCSDSLSVGLETLAGPFVAYELTNCGLSSQDDFLDVVDLRTGKVVKSSDPTSGPDSGGTGDNAIDSLVLTPKGSVGWIGSTVGPLTEVYAWPAKGKKTLLDSGNEVDQQSLALGGTTMYWLKGTTAKSTKLA